MSAKNRRILRLHTVVDRTGLGKSTIYERMNAGTFPRSYKLGPRMVGWLESDIDAWVEGCLVPQGE